MRIFLNEEQLKYINQRVTEAIHAPNYDKFLEKNGGEWSPDKPFPITIDKGLTTYTKNGGANQEYYKIKNKNNLTRYKKFKDGSIVVSPVSKTLKLRNGNSINIWGLGVLSNADYNHSIKANQIKKRNGIGRNSKEVNVPVDWKNEGKDYLLSYCAEYAAQALPLICKKEGVDVSKVGYVAWPYSSSVFNDNFVRTFLVPAFNEKGINISDDDVIPNIVIKSRDIKIDYDLAKRIGCDDVDIKNLQLFVSAQKEIQTTLQYRHEVDALIERVISDINNNNVDQYYQYSSDRNDKEEKKSKEGVFSTKNGMYLNNVKSGENDPWVKQRSNSQMTNVDLTNRKNKKIEDYEIGYNFDKIASELAKKKDAIMGVYKEAQGKINKIKNAQDGSYENLEDEHGRKLNINYGHFQHGQNKPHGFMTTQFLDDTEKEGKAKDSSWQIKKFSEACRRVLYDLFKINDANKNMNYDKSKVLILFDDNVSGGQTIVNVCETLMTGEKGVAWEKIIPLTISFMQITERMDPVDGQKQKDYRDPIAARNGVYGNATTIGGNNSDSYTFHNFDSRRGDTELNDTPIDFQSIIDKEKAEQERTPQISKQPRTVETPTSNTVVEPKKRGRKPMFNTPEEKRQHRNEYQRKYYHKNKDGKNLSGTPKIGPKQDTSSGPRYSIRSLSGKYGLENMTREEIINALLKKFKNIRRENAIEIFNRNAVPVNESYTSSNEKVLNEIINETIKECLNHE